MCRESIIGKLETEETAWSSQEIFSSCLLARTLTRYVEMAIPSGGKMAETSSWLLTYVNHPHPLQRCLGKEVVFNTTIHCSKKKITSTLRLKFKKKNWQLLTDGRPLYTLCHKSISQRIHHISSSPWTTNFTVETSALFHANRWNIWSSNVA